MEVQVKNTEGEVAGTVEVSDRVWGEPMHGAVLHQVIVAQQANRRRGTHDTKRRSDVIHSNSKLRIQKHTGRARLGDRGAPQLRGGGVAHGPHPRRYRQRIPRRIRRQALRVALSEQLRRGRVTILEGLSIDTPKTKSLVDLTGKLGVQDGVTIVTRDADHGVVKSASNVPHVQVTVASNLNALDVYRARHLMITREAARRIDEIWDAPEPRPVRRAGGERAGKLAAA